MHVIRRHLSDRLSRAEDDATIPNVVTADTCTSEAGTASLPREPARLVTRYIDDQRSNAVSACLGYFALAIQAWNSGGKPGAG